MKKRNENRLAKSAAPLKKFFLVTVIGDSIVGAFREHELIRAVAAAVSETLGASRVALIFLGWSTTAMAF